MKYILLSIITISCSVCAAGQSSFVMSYPISFALGDQHDYVTKTSFRGINFEFLHPTKKNVEVGIETGWNVFYERVDNKDYQKGSATISGVQFRYVNSVPILGEIRYHLSSDGKR